MFTTNKAWPFKKYVCLFSEGGDDYGDDGDDDSGDDSHNDNDDADVDVGNRGIIITCR